MGHLDDEDAETIYATTSRHPEHVIRRHVLRVCFKFCDRSKRLNWSWSMLIWKKTIRSPVSLTGRARHRPAPCKSARVPNARGTATTSTGGTPKRFGRPAVGC